MLGSSLYPLHMAFRKNGDAQTLGTVDSTKVGVDAGGFARADAPRILKQIVGRNLTVEEAEDIKRAADAAARTDFELRHK